MTRWIVTVGNLKNFVSIPRKTFLGSSRRILREKLLTLRFNESHRIFRQIYHKNLKSRYTVDVIGFLVNQKKIIACVEQMHKIDEKLLKENIEFDYSRMKRMTIILVVVITSLELSLVTYNLLLFQEFKLNSLYWICTGIPILLSTISKVWYVALVYNVKQKFSAINDHFENTRNVFDLSKKDAVGKALKKYSDDESDLPGYLHKEILCKPMKRNRKSHRMDEISISGRIEKGNQGSPYSNGRTDF